MVRYKLIANICAIVFSAFGVAYQLLLCFTPTLSNAGHIGTSIIVLAGAFLAGYMKQNHLIITTEDTANGNLKFLRWVLRILCALFFVVFLFKYIV